VLAASTLGIVEYSARRSLLLDSIDTALKGLATVPQDALVTQLIVDAQRLRQEVERWGDSAPPEEEVAAAEKRALSLNMGVAEVRRDDGSS
jgi:hypothetical protein